MHNFKSLRILCSAIALIASIGQLPLCVSQQCQPEKINQLLKEIMACQGDPNEPPSSGLVPAIPQGGARPRNGPRRFPGIPGLGPQSSGPDGFPTFYPTFLTSTPQRGGGGGESESGVFVSRPIPVDVRPVEGDGVPKDTQFFIAGPRSRPSGLPSFGGSGGPGNGIPFPINPFARREPPQKPSEAPSSRDSPTNGMDFGLSSLFPNYAKSFGGFGGQSPSYDIDPRFGGIPSLGNPFGSSFPSTDTPSGGNTFTFDITPSAGGFGGNENPLGIDFDEILRILKEIQGQGAAGDGSGDGDEKSASSPGLDSDSTTEGIIEVDTTISPTMETEATTESTTPPATTVMPTEK